MEKVTCRDCKSANVGPPYKEWTMKGRVQGKDLTGFHPTKRNTVRVRLYKCGDCGAKFRVAESIKEEQKK